GQLVAGGRLTVGREVGARLEAQRGAVGNVDAIADRPVRPDVAEAPDAVAVEIHGRVAAQEVKALLGAEIQHEAPRPEPYGEVRPGSAALGVRPLVQSLRLDPQPVRDPEADAAPAPDLVVELEGAVEPREASEPAELELELVLGVESGGPAHQQHHDDRDYPHGTTPRGQKATPKIGNSSGKRDTPSL